MCLFRRKKTPELQVVSFGDYVFINKDTIFRVDYDALVQLPIVPVHQNKVEESENQ